MSKNTTIPQPQRPRSLLQHSHLFPRSRQLSLSRPSRLSRSATRTLRGDMLIEVMLAITIFSLVAVLSLAMMNAGVNGGERTLELSTARAELNSQAEMLRFIHSSYSAERSLNPCSATSSPTDLCQHYAALWDTIISNAVSENTIPYPLDDCSEVYDSNLLRDNHAFVINTRAIDPRNSLNNIYISAYSHPNLFKPAELSARLIFSNSTGDEENTDILSNLSSDYRNLAAAEGIWVVAVDKGTGYYDFYIETCWTGPGSSHATSLDTIIRLYSPGA